MTAPASFCRAARKKRVRRLSAIWAALCVLLSSAGIARGAGDSMFAARQPLEDAWWTGPLLAANAGTLPAGHLLFEPYIYDSIPYAAIDSQGVAHRVPHKNDIGSLSYVLYGISDDFTVGFIPRFGYRNAGEGRNGTGPGLGDLTLQTQYQLHQFRDGDWLPTLSLNVGETLPTARYDRLARPGDGLGAGAYATILSLYSQSYFWMPTGRILRARLNLSYSLSRRVRIEDRSVYGTAPGFLGHASPGASFTADLALEYSLTRHWVAATDFWLEQDNRTRLTGTYPSGAADVTLDEKLGPSRVFYVAPALEYNFSNRLGVIAGARIFVIGSNITASITPVIAINTVF
jgi:hypothetical protein